MGVDIELICSLQMSVCDELCKWGDLLDKFDDLLDK